MTPSPRQNVQSMPLAMLSPGERARVVDVRGGRSFVRRLTSLGVIPGTALEVVQNGLAGPLIVKLKESRLALGRGMSHRIMVAPGE